MEQLSSGSAKVTPRPLVNAVAGVAAYLPPPPLSPPSGVRRKVAQKADVLHMSLWDVALVLFVKGVDAISIWGLLVVALNVLVQATITYIVVAKMATNAKIDADTAADFRQASRFVRRGVDWRRGI